MMQAIKTEYRGPTDRRAAIVKASALGGTISIMHDEAYTMEQNHRMAAAMLGHKLGWEELKLEGGWATQSIAYWVRLEAPRE